MFTSASTSLLTASHVSKPYTFTQGNAGERALKRIHIISTGRQGSSFMLQLVELAGDGLPVVFEPLKGVIEGSSLISNQNLGQKTKQISCLYSETASGCGGFVNPESLSKLQEMLAISDHPPVVLKTTRIVNLTLLAETLSTEQKQGSKFLIMVRDPRAVWASFKHFHTWAVHSIPLVCKLLAETLLTAPALAQAAPGHVEFAIYEMWSEDLMMWSKDLADLIGQDGHHMAAFAQTNQQSANAPKWITDLTDDEVSRVESDPNCAAYMERVGYQRGKASGPDYISLRSSEELRQDLNQKEKAVLASLDGKHENVALVGLPNNELLFEFRSPR